MARSAAITFDTRLISERRAMSPSTLQIAGEVGGGGGTDHPKIRSPGHLLLPLLEILRPARVDPNCKPSSEISKGIQYSDDIDQLPCLYFKYPYMCLYLMP